MPYTYQISRYLFIYAHPPFTPYIGQIPKGESRALLTPFPSTENLILLLLFLVDPSSHQRGHNKYY